jgi:hypothetical protein
VSSFIFYTPAQIFYADQVKENEVDRTCGTHGRGEEGVQGLDGKARRKETTWETKMWMGGWDQNGS